MKVVVVLAIAGIVGAAGEALASSRAPSFDGFDAKQSAALFVGVSRFPYDPTLADVRYAADDAVDLAFAFALDDRVRLVDPNRVILALSGEPQKTESRQNLARLVTAGAQVRAATQIDILTALDEHARAAGGNGLLILTFSTHGVSYDDTQYLLTASSALRYRETAIREDKIRGAAARSGAGRSLILVDACRERLRNDQRSGSADNQSAAALIQAMAGTPGQVVLSAAAPGQYAYDDDTRRNGVFTAAVLDGLRCQAATDERGLVTVDTLAAFVKERVLTWIRTHKDADVGRATQVMWEGQAKTMPVADCRRKAVATPASACTVAIGSSPSGATVTMDGTVVGVTPVTIRVAKEGRTEVVLVKSGYRAGTEEVDCARSEPVFVTLRPHREKPQVLLRETFDTNSRNWYLSNDPDAPAELKDGAYVLGSKQSQLRYGTTPVPLDEDADFEISVSVRRLTGADDQICGLVWGMANGVSFSGFFINGKGNVSVGVLERGAGAPLNDTNVVHPSVRVGGGLNRLKVAKVGTRLRYFVNGALVHERPYRPFFGSGIGVAAISGPIVAAFDDLTVEGYPQ